MKYQLPVLIVLLLLPCLVIEAQTDVVIRKRDFNSKKSGFEEAWKHVTEGNNYYNKKGIWYGKAFAEFSKANLFNDSVAELNYKTGVSALLSDNKEKSSVYLLKAYELKNNLTDDILFLTGRSLQYEGRFSEAIEKYNSYVFAHLRKELPEVKLAKKYIEECNAALIITADTLRIDIKNAGQNMNSAADDYSEIISDDGETMFFASRRELPKSGNNFPDFKFDENIFSSVMINDSWGVASLLSEELMSKYCETPVYMNSSIDTLYIYSGYVNNGDIMISFKKKGKWKTPQPVSFGIDSWGHQTSFTMNNSENEIYFISDYGKDNIGGKDIYFSRKINKHKWTKPLNLGPAVNSAYDEESVRLSEAGDTLWFSSKGHNSIGGFDIFYSIKNQEGKWDSVRNIGYPVNTVWDDLFYYPSRTDKNTFYFASDRSGGFGGFDIYQGRILPPLPPAVVDSASLIVHDTLTKENELPASALPDSIITVKPDSALPDSIIPDKPVQEPGLNLNGKVTDTETGEPLMVTINIIDIETDLVLVSSESSAIDGSYKLRIPSRKSFFADLKGNGFMSARKRIEMPDSFADDSFTLDVTLTKAR